MTKSDRGILITFEGGEGSGKTTQITRLRERLHQVGQDVVVLREPGGTAIGEQIREVVLSSKNIGMAFTTEVLLFQAARAQIYREVVLPSLEAGKVVLMDRSRDSSLVYQGIVRGFGETLIDQLNDLSTKETYPDKTILLDLPVKVGLERKQAMGEENRLELENQDFHEQVRKAYLAQVKKDRRQRWVLVDASQDPDRVAEAVWKSVAELFTKQK